MATARQVITSSMRKIGALTKNEQPAADEADDGLEMLNDMVASWSNQGIQIPARVTESFPLNGSTSYTIGPGGNFNTTRPISIASSYVRLSTFDRPVEKITDEDYAAIQFKEINGAPDSIHYDGAYPLGTIRLYPVPDASYTLFLVMEKPLASFASLNAIVDLAPGTKRALIYNLAIEMAPEYGQPVTPEIAELAAQAKASIAIAITRNRTMDVPRRNTGARNNIYSGFF